MLSRFGRNLASHNIKVRTKTSDRTRLQARKTKRKSIASTQIEPAQLCQICPAGAKEEKDICAGSLCWEVWMEVYPKLTMVAVGPWWVGHEKQINFQSNSNRAGPPVPLACLIWQGQHLVHFQENYIWSRTLCSEYDVHMHTSESLRISLILFLGVSVCFGSGRKESLGEVSFNFR